MFLASVSLRPEMRASSGADAVLTSAPTALTQSSTTASSFFASCAWLTSCWYWPTPIAFGLDAHQLGERILQPPRDRDRAAQRDVEVGKLLGAPARTPSRPTRPLPTPRPW